VVDEDVSAGPLGDLDEEVEVSDAPANGLEALLTEHASERLGPLWLAEITKAASIAKRYNPRIYAQSSVWDEGALSDVVQDVVERMLVKSQVEYICDVANDFGHARALVYRQVKMTLADRRQRTSVDNLFDRAKERLAEPPFEVTSAKPPTWGLAGSDAVPKESPQRLATALAALPRLPGRGKDRASAVWTKETLEDALLLICRTVGTVAEADLRKILDDALTVFATSEVVTDDAGLEGRADELDPADLAVASEALDRLTASLTREEAAVLAGKWIGDSDGDIAARLSISRPTVAKHKDSAFAKVRDELASSEQPVIEYVVGRLQARIVSMGGGS
jgi:DNA-binding CsgD family transcriptional regulator